MQWRGLDIENTRTAGLSLTVGASSPLLSCSNKHGHVSLKNPEQGIQLYSGNSCPRSCQGSGERNRYGGKGSLSNSPLVLNPWMPSASRPTLGQSPLGPNPAPAVCCETGSQVFSSGSCVGSVQADGVRGPQKLLPCGGPQVCVHFRITESLVRGPPTFEKNS